MLYYFLFKLPYRKRAEPLELQELKGRCKVLFDSFSFKKKNACPARASSGKECDP